MAQRMTYIDRKRAEEEAAKKMSFADLVKTTKKGYDLYSAVDDAAPLASLAPLAPSAPMAPGAAEIVGSGLASDGGAGYLLSNGSTVPAPLVGGSPAASAGAAATPLSQIAGGAAILGGAYAGYQGIKNKDPVSAGLGGGGIGLGLTQLGYTIPGWGWALAIGAPVAMSLLNKWGDKDRWKTEQDAARKLAKSGVTGWSDYVSQQPEITRGRSRGELEAIENAKLEGGKYENPTYARTRNMGDSTAKDWWGYSAWGNKFGNDYFGKFSENDRERLVGEYLNRGLLQDKGGSLKINSSQAQDDEILGLLGLKENKATTGVYK